MRRAARFVDCSRPSRVLNASVALLSTYTVLCILLSSYGAHATTTTTSSTVLSDTRGPSGRRHNFWWWLALGVSSALIVLLILLLVASWWCCVRHQQRDQGEPTRRCDDDGLLEGAVSTSPDNFITDQGSHDTKAGARPHSTAAAAVTAANYVNTTRDGYQLGHGTGTATEPRQIEVQHDGRRVIFLTGGGRGGASRRSRRSLSPRKQAPPPRGNAAAAAPVAVWSNKPRTPAPAATMAMTRPLPAAERVLPVEEEMSDNAVSPNPLSLSSVRHIDADEKMMTAAPAAATAVVGSTDASAGKPLLTTADEAAEAPAFTRPPSATRRSTHPEQAGMHSSATFHQVEKPEQQRQLAKSPMRFSVKSRSITTSEAVPTAPIDSGISKEYCFESQHNATTAVLSTARGPTVAKTATAVQLQETPDQAPETRQPVQRQPAPSVQEQPHLQWLSGVAEQRQASPQGERVVYVPRRRPSPTSSSVAEKVHSGGNGQPSRAAPYISHVFSPLQMAGLEGSDAQLSRAASTGRRSDVGEAASVAAPIVMADRPPRCERLSLGSSLKEKLVVSISAAAAAVAAAGEQQQQQHRHSSPPSSSKKRIELFRRGSYKRKGPSRSRGNGWPSSAPAANGRVPLPAAVAPAPFAASSNHGNDDDRHTPSTVTKGVPQLFFGKREGSPASRPSAHQRPPRPDAGALHGQAKGNGEDHKVLSLLSPAAMHSAQASPASLFPSGGSPSARHAVSAAAALVGGGARAGSWQNSTSSYGSGLSSMNGGNSLSTTSLGRVRSPSKVKFLEQDEVPASMTGGELLPGVDCAGVGPSASSAHGRDKGSTPNDAATSTLQRSRVSSSLHGSGVILKGRPSVAPAATVSGAARKVSLPHLPSVPATAQVAMEQGRATTGQRSSRQQQALEFAPNTATVTTTPRAAAGAQWEQPRRNTSPARQYNANVRASHESVTPPFSAETATPLETPQIQPLREILPARTTLPSSATQQHQPLHPSLQRSSTAEAAVNAHGRPCVPQVFGGASPVRADLDELESMSSEASTMPAGLLPSRGQGRNVTASATATQTSKSPTQHPLYSSISPYSSTRRVVPPSAAAAAAPTEVSNPRHSLGIEVLRITSPSGDVQVMPPPSSACFSQHSRDTVDHRLTNNTSRFASYRAAGEDDDYVVGAGGGSAHALWTLDTTDPRRGLGAQYGSSRSSHRFGSATNGSRRAH
ncbi:hypothetical protein ABL78_5330 [Leptomonas seymouri]|uniref:Uncharacterized protein n=1 Tax=Leptomonas seymouri TaxID=5684 RepID=A0A0N1PCH6_LEPSE|nr:hypothetical protein ABL78_5330 [Leptomonas seymouri]|eukprot:KPI85620.1 hypothetical protein ABL78_5330 [Leptomonas seymouri]